MSRALLPVLILLLAFIASCVPINRARRWTNKTRAEGVNRTARIHTSCIGSRGWAQGSGVVLEPNVILTAYHVVECKGDSTIYIEHDGTAARAYLGMASPESDLALLVVESPLNAPPVEFGPPPPKGSGVCAYPARKDLGPLCGYVQRRKKTPKEDLAMRMQVQPGDSGSGVYDKRGRLVGVVISRLPPNQYGEIVGFATLLTGKLTREE